MNFYLYSVVSYLSEKYERDAKKYWDIFYKHHGDRVSLFFSVYIFLNSHMIELICVTLLIW